MMKVILLHADTLELIDHGLSECYNQPQYHNTEPDKAEKRIHKVCNLYKHDSLLEFSSATWEIEASTKVLLEMTRHRLASYACKSSRYTLNKSELIFEKTGDPEVDLQLSKWQATIEDMISLGKKNDIVSLMLPQAYQYRWQVQMNYRSLKNYFSLRLDPHAHYQIKEVSELMLKSLPENIQKLFKD